MVNHPISHEDQAQRERHHKKSHLHEASWAAHRPRFALFGVGVLGPGHRFYEEAKAPKHEPGLQPIRDLLCELVQITDQITNDMKTICPWYRPVADIANHLFCVRGRHWEDAVKPELRDKVEELVNQINDKLLTVTPRQLQDVENVILVAGTESKAIAIRHLLATEQCNIRFLVTDKKTAERVLKKPH